MKKMRQGVLAAALLTILLLTGCASLGKAELDSAKSALAANKPSFALVYATEALLKDPKFDDAKEFLKENTEPALDQILTFIGETALSTEPSVVEKRFDSYSNLDQFYTNLKTIGLPLVKGKKLFGLIKGWEWSIPLKDYSVQVSKEREKAREVFLENGYDFLEKGELDTAEELLKKVIKKFAVSGSEEQKQDRLAISNRFSAWAARFHGSKDPDTLLKALDAYDLALSFSRDNEEAASGRDRMKKELSEVYLNLGLAEEKKNSIEALKAAIDFFERALKYNSGNQPASEGIERSRHKIAVIYNAQGEELANSRRLDDMVEAHSLFEKALEWDSAYTVAAENRDAVTLRIAEYHYQTALRYEKNLNNSEALDSAIAAYDKALEWSPDYKDSAVRRNRLKVSIQVILLEKKLGQTVAEYERTNRRIVALSQQVAKGHKGIEDLFYVSDKIIQLDQQMKTIKTAISPLSSIPLVGPVFTTTGTVLGRSHRPVKAASDKVKTVQRPYITPSREMIGKVKAQVEQIVGTMGEIKQSLIYVQTAVAKLNGCIQTLDDPDTVREVERDAKRLNNILDDLNDGLDTVNDTQDKVEGTMTALANSVSVISDVSGGMRKIMGPMDKISSVTNEINKVLRKKIKIPFVGSFTVGEAIESTTGVVRKAAEKLLNPLLDELNIDIPTIPGLDDLNRILDNVEGYYADIKNAEAQIREAADKILDVPQELRSTVDNMAAKTGCSF